MGQQYSLEAGSPRLQMTESIKLAIDSLLHYGANHRHWAIAWSGGKDSSTLLTLVVYLILSGKVPPPLSLTVLYADTRMELLPLWIAAQTLREELAEKSAALAALGCKLTVRTVMAPMDKRFLVYILGRGVPPPNNMTFRWCTEGIKIKPMESALEALAVELGFGVMVEKTRRRNGKEETKLVYRGHGTDKMLVLTGVRIGESAVRDDRIITSCSKDKGECGQGWYQKSLPTSLCDTLAPILHFRICHIWEWLAHWAPRVEFGDWSTELLADAYGGRDGNEAAEIQARTGCVGCPLAELDLALDALLKLAHWAYLAPLKGLRAIYRWLRTPPVRLRKRAGEKRKNGETVENQQRMGPITLDARREALRRVLAIQAEVNEAADAQGRPRIDLLNAEEVARINELIDANTWPEKWEGTEPTADEEFEPVFSDGYTQTLLFGLKPKGPDHG